MQCISMTLRFITPCGMQVAEINGDLTVIGKQAACVVLYLAR